MNNKGQLGLFLGIAGIAIIAIILLIGFDYVPAGTVGVRDKLGEINPTPLQPGVYWTGLTTTTHEISTRIQIQNYVATAASSDLQDVTTKVAINYRISGEEAPRIFSTITYPYHETILTPIVNDAVRDAASKFTAEQLITKRTDAKAMITNQILDKVQKRGLIIEEVSMTNFEFSEEFNNAIERKQVAEQDVLTAKNKLEETRLLVEGSKLQQQILEARKLDLQQQWISKWNGETPNTLVIGADTETSVWLTPELNR